MSIIVFLYGLIFGSFFNVCIYRIPKGVSLSSPPSTCGKCNTGIKFYDLIPVISYLFLGGKCRNCKEKISFRYPFIEILTGVIFYLTFIKYGLSLEFFKFIIMESFLIIIGMIDFDTTDVYFKTTLPAFLIGVLFVVYKFASGSVFLEYIIGAILASSAIFFIVILTRGMGAGDIEIAAIIGIFLGTISTLLALFLAIVIAGIFAIILMLGGKKRRGDAIAFGPFLSLGAILAALYGSEILNWYFKFFHL